MLDPGFGFVWIWLAARHVLFNLESRQQIVSVCWLPQRYSLPPNVHRPLQPTWVYSVLACNRGIEDKSYE